MADKEKTELKPCPCCETEVELQAYDDLCGLSPEIKCPTCRLRMTRLGNDDVPELATAWNTRPSTAHEQALLSKLEGMYQTVRGLKKELAQLTKNAMHQIEFLVNESEDEINRVKLRNSELVDAVLYLKELLYRAKPFLDRDFQDAALETKADAIWKEIEAVRQAQEDTDKKAEEAGEGKRKCYHGHCIRCTTNQSKCDGCRYKKQGKKRNWDLPDLSTKTARKEDKDA